MTRDRIHEPTVIGNMMIIPNWKVLDEIITVIELRQQDFEDPKCQLAYEVITDCYRRHVTPTPAIVHTESRGRLDLSWLEEISLQEVLSTDETISRAKLVLAQSDRREVSNAMVTALGALERGDEVDEVRNWTVDRLTRVRGVNTLDSSAPAILARIDKQREDGTRMFVTPTQIPWLDMWLKGGFHSNRFLAIAGPQGGRKSTWARNIVLGLTRDKKGRPREDVSVAWMGYENDQQITFFDFVSMLSVEWIYENKLQHTTMPDASGDKRSIVSWLDAESLESAYHKNMLDKMPEVLRRAFEVGIDRASRLPLSIYDSAEDTGYLVDRDALMRGIRSHHWRHGSSDRHYIVFIDYAQLVRQGPKLYEDMEQLSRECLKVCRKFNATIVLLSQYNEDTNKNLTTTPQIEGQQYWGLKGGGDIRAGVHNLMIVEYNQQVPDKLNVRAAKARRGKSSGAVTLSIDPISGLVL